jgi:O-antigen/teichoic acid export membrane protein
MNLSRQTIIHFAASVIKSIAGFVATIIIARFLGSSDLGVYSLALALLFWIEIPFSGFETAIMKRVSEDNNQASYFTTGFIINLLIATGISGLILALKSELNGYLGKDIITLVILLLFSKMLFGLVLAGLRGQKQVGVSGIIQAIERIFRTILQVGLIFLSYEVGGLIVGHTLSMIIALVSGLWFFKFGIARPQMTYLRDLYDYAKYSWVGQLQGKAYGWLDTIVLGLFVSSSLVGIYEVAWSLSAILVLVNRSILQSLFPEVSSLNEEDNYGAIQDHITEALTFSGLVMFPGFIGAVVIGERVLKIYAAEFSAGATILVILIIAQMSSSVGKLFSSIIYALDEPEVAFRIDVPIMLSNLVLNFILIPTIGWHGAAVATAATGIINLLLSYYVLQSLIDHITVSFRPIIEQVSASILMGIIVWSAGGYIPNNNYTTIGLVMLGALIYSMSLLALSNRFRNKLFSVLKSFE